MNDTRTLAASRLHNTTRLVRTPTFLIAMTVLLLGALGVTSLCIGQTSVAPSRLVGLLFGDSGSVLDRVVVRDLRVPRLVLCILAGAVLAIAGLLLQDLLQNPIASPELLGVSSGASLAMAIILVIGVPLPIALHPAAALVGGLLGAGLVSALIGTTRGVGAALCGAVAAALINALVLIVISLAAGSGSVQLFFFFAVGDVANRTWSHVHLVLWWVLPLLPMAALLARPVMLAQLDGQLAASAGLHVARLRYALFAVCAGLIAAVVATCGPIAWVGLLAPHLARLVVNSHDTRRTLPVAAALGAVVLVSADVVSRTIVYPSELPVGLCTTLLAGPAALFLMRHRSVRGTTA